MTIRQLPEIGPAPFWDGSLKRTLEIVFGIVLILVGIFLSLPFVPGPGIPVIFFGVLLVSPYHGRRLFWRARLVIKWLKEHYYAWRHGYRSKKKHDPLR